MCLNWRLNTHGSDYLTSQAEILIFLLHYDAKMEKVSQKLIIVLIVTYKLIILLN